MTLPDLDDLIAEVDRTCDAAHTGDESGQPDWIELLVVAARLAGQLQALADDLVEDYVEHCRLHGYSWNEIGAALGVSRQAAQQRFIVPHKRYGPEEFSAELRQALAHTKQIAVQRRNNYIGTEHLLWGLLAEDNTATALLRSLEISAEGVRRSLDSRLGLGASQAAERIAFTPYSRKAMAIAKEIAEQEGAAGIGCAHLLVALARVARGIAARELAEAGAGQAALDAALTRPGAGRRSGGRRSGGRKAGGRSK